jgi:hypothetical protein
MKGNNIESHEYKHWFYMNKLNMFVMIVLYYREVQGCDNLKEQVLQDKNNLISVMYLGDMWKERQRGTEGQRSYSSNS